MRFRKEQIRLFILLSMDELSWLIFLTFVKSTSLLEGKTLN